MQKHQENVQDAINRMSTAPVVIIGGGLAGCEAAWQLLRRGHSVHLCEMKPQTFSPAHKMEHLAELVCSNSLKSNSLDNASGLLKEEMRRLHSLIMMAADVTTVAAGSALAVDRLQFACEVEARLHQQKNFTLSRMEVTTIPPDALTIIATGPLTSDALAREITRMLDNSYLYFYDAIAPIIEADSIQMDKVFWASRYDKGTPDYLNCPLNKEEYERLRQELLTGEKVAAKPFEEVRHFESCLPVEVLAARGEKSLAFGPMKPVGLVNPQTGKIPYAVVQLRRENTAGTLFNMVGFQTKLTWPEQWRVFRLIPGLENAEFARYGSIHRNTFIHSPSLLLPSLQLKSHENIFFAGQMTGVEGYVESAAMGLLAGLNAALMIEGRKPEPPPVQTALGALLHYITSPDHAGNFQPMNINFGLLGSAPAGKMRKKERNALIVHQALQALHQWMERQKLA
ncbi:MAG TPA: methylenetetrahydrofolate--tRNA-(uracil(54)-C(5))-methyltransferase (FADH(2)-oxidizing) TrmFO [Smithella sp.]|nr:methylenetetrahydrofolate--tRNA-(uracil(54)-C(5))-methyltransferase (FADH(2)-oxidizing) TrmFO [Smithella sp.]HOG91446.1 methylenetetrahydrofolate--tRNA-(uracil(54)-C(5))-methyltransferase (FADH(2)-oxidizing) TrmFO [Smithella sp.]